MLLLSVLKLISLLLFSPLTAGDHTCTDPEFCAIRPENTPVTESVYEPECVYYLAPSSIPNAGFGTYTVKEIKEHNLLMKQADAPSIALSNYKEHNERNRKRNLDKIPLAVHHNYFTDGFDIASFEVDGDLDESVVNFAFVNHHSYLFNIHHAAEEYDDSITPRSSGSPGLGAYSYVKGYNMVASMDIHAGEEFFFDHGENWLDLRNHCKNIPRQNDYTMAANVIERMILSGMNSGSDLNDKVVAFINQIASICQESDATSLSLSLDDISAILDQFSYNSSLYHKLHDSPGDIATALAKKQLIPRTIDWIMSEGKCLDNLVPNISTLQDAGKGAFAQRFIPKGSIVVPAPVLQIADASELNMYDFDTNELIGTQLLMNYCFSHPGTPLLFCPQTNAILINHCSNRSSSLSYGGDCDQYNSNQDLTLRGPNAYVRWATEWDPETEQSLNISLEDFHIKTQEGRRLLTMEIIASRNIYPGDEVFIDYGEEWEQAWDDHVRNWKPPTATNYAPVKVMNDNVVDLKTPDELESDPYPENIRLACRYFDDDDDEFEDLNEKETLDEYDDEELWVTSDVRFLDAVGKGSYWPCSVMDRIEDGPDGVYTVEILQSQSWPDTKWTKLGHRRIIEKFPRQSISFRPVGGSTDHYLPGVFRQPLGLPRDMVVERWMMFV